MNSLELGLTAQNLSDKFEGRAFPHHKETGWIHGNGVCLRRAWSVGFVARFATGGASSLTLGGGAGEFGIVSAKEDYPQPRFDEHGGIYLVYHAIKGLAKLPRTAAHRAGNLCPARDSSSGSLPRRGYRSLVNKPDKETKDVELAPRPTGSVSILSGAEFEQATKDLSAMDSLEHGLTGPRLVLPPHAVARLKLATE